MFFEEPEVDNFTAVFGLSVVVGVFGAFPLGVSWLLRKGNIVPFCQMHWASSWLITVVLTVVTVVVAFYAAMNLFLPQPQNHRD